MPALVHDELVDGLRSLGIRPGDVVLARAALRAMGRWAPNNGEALLAALRAAVGPEGTVMCLAHSGVGRGSKAPTFTREAPAIIGGFANILLQADGAVRSTHPTHSFAAVGGDARALAAAHTPASPCFGFVGELVERDAVMLLVGCSEVGPGFSTLDYAQLQAGLVYQTRRKAGTGAYYVDDNGARQWFERTDEPGCSRGFGNLYREYLRDGALRAGPVGEAYSLAGRSAALHATDRRVVDADPRAPLCADPLCSSCRFERTYNKRDVPLYLVRRGAHAARRLAERVLPGRPSGPAATA